MAFASRQRWCCIWTTIEAVLASAPLAAIKWCTASMKWPCSSSAPISPRSCGYMPESSRSTTAPSTLRLGEISAKYFIPTAFGQGWTANQPPGPGAR
jgi:hypothetical protein